MTKILILLSIVLVLALAGSYFITVDKKKEIAIAANFDNCMEQVMHPKNWNNWFPLLNLKNDAMADIKPLSPNGKEKRFIISGNGKSYEVSMVNPALYIVQQLDNSNSANIFSIGILPRISPDSVMVTVISRTRLLYSLFPFLCKTGGLNTVIALKTYLEDPVSFYGFTIGIEQVVNTAYLTKKIVAPAKELHGSLGKGFNSIEEFITTNALEISGKKSVFFKPLLKDSIAAMLGIPIVPAQIPADDSITNLMMPKGRMLIGLYDGRFDKRHELHTAMRKYISDRHLSQVSVEFEEYVDNRLPATDSSMVKIRLYFPIL